MHPPTTVLPAHQAPPRKLGIPQDTAQGGCHPVHCRQQWATVSRLFGYLFNRHFAPHPASRAPCLLQDKAHKVAGEPTSGQNPWLLISPQRAPSYTLPLHPSVGGWDGPTASLLDELSAGCFPRPWAFGSNGHLLHSQSCSAQFPQSPGVRFRADHADTAYDPTDNLKVNSHKKA